MVCFLCAVIVGLVFALFTALRTKPAPPAPLSPSTSTPRSNSGPGIVLILLLGVLALIGVFFSGPRLLNGPLPAASSAAPPSAALVSSSPPRSVWHLPQFDGEDLEECSEVTIVGASFAAAPLPGMTAGTCAESFPQSAVATCTQRFNEGPVQTTVVTHYYRRARTRHGLAACRADHGEWWVAPGAEHRDGRRRIRAARTEPNAEPERDSSGPRTYVAPTSVTGWDPASSVPAPDYGANVQRPVHVRGYTRRDGTYVQPYTRSAPRR